MYEQLKFDASELTPIKGTLIVVVIFGILSLATLTVLMVLVMPKFLAMFDDLGVELPLPTQILIGATDAFQTYWWVGFLIVIVGAVGLRQYLRLETDPSWFNRLRVKLSPKHLTIFISLFVVLVAVMFGFIAVAMILPIFEANQLLSG